MLNSTLLLESLLKEKKEKKEKTITYKDLFGGKKLKKVKKVKKRKNRVIYRKLQ